MTTDALIQAVRGQGLRLSMNGGHLVVTGRGRRDAATLATIRERKIEIIARLKELACPTGERSEQSAGSCGGYRSVPPDDIPLVPAPPLLSAEHATGLEQFVIQQDVDGPGPILGWVMRRANRYFQAYPGWTHQQQDLAVSLDLLRWQCADIVGPVGTANGTQEPDPPINAVPDGAAGTQAGEIRERVAAGVSA